MIKRFVCLANSIKLGGRCLAGIVLDGNNRPAIRGGRPLWIRPVSETEHGEVPTALVSEFKVLDIISFETSGPQPNAGFQSENFYYDDQSFCKSGTFDKARLESLYETNQSVFGNAGKAVHADKVHELDHSLVMIRVTDFKTRYLKDDVHPTPQLRMTFYHEGTRYDLPITDPVFIDLHKSNGELLKGIRKLFLILSLAVENNGWHSKLIASVVY